MKILLLNPPTPFEKPEVPPLGLAYIAAVLEKEGFKVKIIDMDLERKTMDILPSIVESFGPEIVGISALTPQMDNAYKIARTIKESSSGIIVVVGGPHPSGLPEQTLQGAEGCIDIVAFGEGEYTLLDIAKKKEYKDIPGIVYKQNGKIYKNRRRAPIEDLDALPLPARHMLKMTDYPGWGPSNETNTHIIASRGCPFNCIFCSEKAVFGRNHRRRDPQRVVDEIEILTREYGIEEIDFYDDLFTANKQWCMSICDEIISRKLNISWKTLARPDIKDLGFLKKMRDAGCWLLFYGFESGSPEILKNIRKQITPEQSIEVARLTKKAGIEIYGFFMIGNPGETRETIYKTIKLAKKIEPDYYQFTIVRPDPGSDLFNMFKKEIEQKNISWSDYYAFPSDPGSMPVVGTNLQAEELLKYRKKAYAELDSLLSPKSFSGLLRKSLRHPIKTITKAIRKPSKVMKIVRKPW